MEFLFGSDRFSLAIVAVSSNNTEASQPCAEMSYLVRTCLKNPMYAHGPVAISVYILAGNIFYEQVNTVSGMAVFWVGTQIQKQRIPFNLNKEEVFYAIILKFRNRVRY